MEEYKLNDLISVKSESTTCGDEFYIYVDNKPLNQYNVAKLGPIITDILNNFDKIADKLDKVALDWRVPLFYKIVKAMKGTKMREKLMVEKFNELINWIDNIQDTASVNKIHEKNRALFVLFNGIKGTEIMDSNFSLIDKKFKEIVITLFNIIQSNKDSPFSKYEYFSYILKNIQRTKLMIKNYSFVETKFKILVKEIEDLPKKSHLKHMAFSKLLKSIKRTEILQKHYLLIDSKLKELLLLFDEIEHQSVKNFALRELFQSIKETDLLKDNYEGLLNQIYKLEDLEKASIFTEVLHHTIKKSKLLQDKFPELLKGLDYLHEKVRIGPFHTLLNSIKKKKNLMNQYYSLINAQFRKLLKITEKSQNLVQSQSHHDFMLLVRGVKGTDILRDNFVDLINSIDRFQDYGEYFAFSALLEVIKGTELLNKHFSHVESKFTKLLNKLDNSSDNFKCNVFLPLITPIRGTKLMEDNLPALLTAFERLPVRFQSLVIKTFPEFSLHT
ncbi:MAG: hypothetical protein ACFFEY_03680 [Candidatus Thorarchaeota archaeon]